MVSVRSVVMAKVCKANTSGCVAYSQCVGENAYMSAINTLMVVSRVHTNMHLCRRVILTLLITADTQLNTNDATHSWAARNVHRRYAA